MSKNNDIAIYYASADNSEGWVTVLNDFLVHFIEQKKVAPPKIELVEYGNTADCKIAIAILSNNTISLSNVKATGENLFVIKINLHGYSETAVHNLKCVWYRLLFITK